MQLRVTWRTRDGLTHRATLRGIQDDGPTVRSECGLTSNPCDEDLTHEAVEITCPRCQNLGRSKTHRSPGINAASERPTHRGTPSESPTDEPPLLADILAEMGLPSRKPEAPDPNSVLFQDADLIHRYTRSDALRDGILIDATPTAREASIRYPTALTAAVWSRYVKVPERVIAQDEPSRLWDILWMLRHAIRQASGNTDTVYFLLHVRNDNRRPIPVRLKALCGPDDNRSPCITVMVPDED